MNITIKETQINDDEVKKIIKGDTLFEVEGLMNVNADIEDNQLELIVEIGMNIKKTQKM